MSINKCLHCTGRVNARHFVRGMWGPVDLKGKPFEYHWVRLLFKVRDSIDSEIWEARTGCGLSFKEEFTRD